MMLLAVPDLITPSYFPAVAAVELGFAADEGLDIHIETIHPVSKGAQALKQGEVAFLAGAAHAPLGTFPAWQGVKLVVSLSQKTFWMLVTRADLDLKPGQLEGLRGRRIAAASGPAEVLRQLLADAGLPPDEAGIEICPVPKIEESGGSAGLAAAAALARGELDGFWANAMAAEIATREGGGTVILDPRRGDGPSKAARYTFPALITTDELIANDPTVVESLVRAIVTAQSALRDMPERASEVAEGLFPPMEASLIVDLIRQDVPFYDAGISEDAVTGLIEFAQRAGLLDISAPYEQIVATQFARLW